MTLTLNKKVTFAELPGTELHKYFLVKRKGATPVELSGVTTMMRKLGLSKSYGNVNPDVLARAAARGTAIHEMLQSFEMKGLTIPKIHYEWDCEDGRHLSEDEDCLKMLDNYSVLSGQNFKALAVEYLVSDNESVASMIDFVSEVDSSTVDLVDYKSSSTLDKTGLSWQLSFYKRFFEKQNKGMKVRKLIGIHCHDEKVRMVDVPYMGDEQVDAMLKCFKDKDYVIEDVPVLPATLTIAEVLPDYPALGDTLSMKRELQKAIDKLDEQMAEGIEALKAKMSAEHISEVLVPGGKYVFTEEHAAIRFDSKRFKAEHPAEFEKYSLQSTTAASLKFYAKK